MPAGLPQPQELKAAAEVALQQLKQDLDSKAAALRAAQSKHSGTEALLKSARSQLQAASDECRGLQQKIQQGLAHLYKQACRGNTNVFSPQQHFRHFVIGRPKTHSQTIVVLPAADTRAAGLPAGMIPYPLNCVRGC